MFTKFVEGVAITDQELRDGIRKATITQKIFPVVCGTAFKNKGAGHSVVLKEDITIPAGTKIGIFEDELTGKDGTKYQVLNVTKLPMREQA